LGSTHRSKLVKEWLFGTNMRVSTWEVGGSISYAGSWEGKPYEDKGKILEIVPQQKFVSTYWSAFSVCQTVLKIIKK